MVEALARLRDYAEVMRPLLRGDNVSFTGETISLEGARIEDVLSGDAEAIGDTGDMPVYLGVTGLKAASSPASWRMASCTTSACPSSTSRGRNRPSSAVQAGWRELHRKSTQRW